MGISKSLHSISFSYIFMHRIGVGFRNGESRQNAPRIQSYSQSQSNARFRMLRLVPILWSHTQNETQICEKEYGNWWINLCESHHTYTGANEMTPDELIKVLKRYLRESNQSERLVAARIGVNHHTLHHWLTSEESPLKGSLALAGCFLKRVGYM